ncbi:hypothetical protein NLG97_g215 [Lecanicillium saksenae]|uniref:Uncharacterized protein n=1 Tax=Lecanicillium saksenae TaxID=468837 RepID=A0ACC1R747_9HYPO|nr:hypothetical protein NLG97_g215 [Lecanicillium saksenae]
MHQSRTQINETSLTDQNLPSVRPDRRGGTQSSSIDIGNAADNQTSKVSEAASSPSDYGSFRDREKGNRYVNGSHWAAVLDSITDLKNYLRQEDEATTSLQEQSSTTDQPPPPPQLLYPSEMSDTAVSIIDSLPPRPVVDRLVSHFFNVELSQGILHSGQFLREYEKFWKSPEDTPIVWVGLLFSIMCLSTQCQEAVNHLAQASAEGLPGTHALQPRKTEKRILAETYKSKAIKCLQLGHYTKGGPHVLETLILYVLIEWFYLEDIDFGISVLIANIVQIALHMGYHREPSHFPSISPFAGEMRRRVWAMIVQLDFSVSAQLGLPGVLRHSHVETAQPRNLHDRDFDADMTILPDSRAETEVTPILYTGAKLRLVAVGRKVMDAATDRLPTSYDETVEIDKELNEAKASLPSSLQWKGIASALNSSSLTILLTVFLECMTLNFKVVLHKVFLEPGNYQKKHQPSRRICLEAAMKLLALHHMVDEELEPGGLLYESHWRISSSVNSPFLLATSVLCFYVQSLEKRRQNGQAAELDDGVHEQDIKAELRKSLAIWMRRGSRSREARKAAIAVHHILGNPGENLEPPMPVRDLEMPSPEPAFPPAAAISYFPEIGQVYDFPGAALYYGVDDMSWPAFATVNVTFRTLEKLQMIPNAPTFAEIWPMLIQMCHSPCPAWEGVHAGSPSLSVARSTFTARLKALSRVLI